MKRLTGGKRARGACKACGGFEATVLSKGQRVCWVCAHMMETHGTFFLRAGEMMCGCAPADIYPPDVRVGLKA